MSKLRFMLVLLAASGVIAPANAGAASATVAPPFDTADSRTSCGILFAYFGAMELEGCSADATAEVDGSLGMHLAVESPGGGALPGAQSSTGDAFLTISHVLPVTSQARYRIVAEVIEGTVSTTGQIETQPWDFSNYAELDIEARFFDLWDAVGYPIVDDGEVFAPSDRTGDTIEGELVLTAPDGGKIGGTVLLDLWLWGDASIGDVTPDFGSSQLDVEIRITEISYVTID